MIFYVGVHHLTLARFVERAFVSVNVLRSQNRQSFFNVGAWIMDSGAFSEISKYGGYRYPVGEYGDWITKFAGCGNLEMAVSQDYMCEPDMLKRTGLSVKDHQELTIERYDSLLPFVAIPIMPVLQGYQPSEYINHLEMYQDRLQPNMRVGVGSVCKRNNSPKEIALILEAIKRKRPDIKLHGFGLKTTALENAYILSMLYSADSMAWCMAARREGRNQHNGMEAANFAKKIDIISGKKPHQFPLQ